MDWQRLDRHQSKHILEQVAAASDPHLFSGQSSEASYAPLPFYNDYMVYRLTNYATLPCFSLDFLSNGESFHLLDGSPTPIQLVNKIGGLDIKEANAMAYVDFYLSNIRGEDGDIYLIHDPENLPFLDSLALDQQIELHDNFAAPYATYDGDNERYIVFADLFYGGTLMKSGIIVQKDGMIEIQPKDYFNSDSAAIAEGTS